MNGAQSLIRTLVGGGVDVCFANPGTSEMHFVASLDAVPEMRAVLALFEGVVTGAADGYGRMAERPAATLLHLGPGLANGLANLHNARRAHTPIVNVIGDHALYHKGFGAPLESDIESLTGWLHGWGRTSTDPASVGRDAADAIAAACTPPGRIANLVVPADVSWGDGGVVTAPIEPPAPTVVEDARIAEIAAVLTSGEPTVLLLGHGATRERGLVAASRIAEATG
ncbi:MAG TPA: thiamine pyrophosphate-binding protein, partial [Mycobacterium sp.]|nr:thiamine pyrophosphate-binding protein [Mycobacterium sp.]